MTAPQLGSVGHQRWAVQLLNAQTGLYAQTAGEWCTCQAHLAFSGYAGAIESAELQPEDIEEVLMGNVVSAGVGQVSSTRPHR